MTSLRNYFNISSSITKKSSIISNLTVLKPSKHSNHRPNSAGVEPISNSIALDETKAFFLTWRWVQLLMLGSFYQQKLIALWEAFKRSQKLITFIYQRFLKPITAAKQYNEMLYRNLQDLYLTQILKQFFYSHTYCSSKIRKTTL